MSKISQPVRQLPVTSLTQSLTEEKKGWDISPRRGEATSGEIKIPHESRKAHSHSCAKSQFFRTAWLSRRGEKKVPTTSGEATSGRNYEFPTRHERQFQFPKSWFSRRGEKQIPTTRGVASSGRNSFFHYNC